MLQDYDETSVKYAELSAAVKKQTDAGYYLDALQAAEDAQKAFKSKKDSEGEAAALRKMARLSAVMGKLEDGAKHAQTAIDLSRKDKNANGEAAGALAMAKVNIFAEKADEALTNAKTALSKYEVAKAETPQAAAKVIIGRALLMQGNDKEANESASDAALIFKSNSEKLGEYVAMQLLVDINLFKGKHSKALETSQAMEAIASKMGDISAEGVAKILCATAQRAAGDNRDAVATAQGAVAIFKQLGDTQKIGIAQHLIAESSLSEGLLQDASAAAEKSLTSFRQVRDKSGQAAAMMSMAYTLCRTGDFDKASYRAESAAELYRQIGSISDEAAALRTAACAYLDKKQADSKDPKAAKEAMRTALSALKVFEKAGKLEGVDYASSLQTLANALVASEEYDKAMERATEAKDIFAASDDIAGVAACMNSMAQVYFAKGDVGEAITTAKEARALYDQVDNEGGALYSQDLIDTFMRPPVSEEDKEAMAIVDAPAPGKKPKKEQEPVVNLNKVNVTIMTENQVVFCQHEAFESRAATTPAARKPRSQDQVAPIEVGDTSQAGIFAVRWVQAQAVPKK